MKAVWWVSMKAPLNIPISASSAGSVGYFLRVHHKRCTRDIKIEG